MMITLKYSRNFFGLLMKLIEKQIHRGRIRSDSCVN